MGALDVCSESACIESALVNVYDKLHPDIGRVVYSSTLRYEGRLYSHVTEPPLASLGMDFLLAFAWQLPWQGGRQCTNGCVDTHRTLFPIVKNTMAGDYS